MDNKIGRLNFDNEIFIGKEELERSQSFYRNFLISFLRSLGSKGLLNYRQDSLEISYTYNNQTREYTVSLNPQSKEPILLGFDGENPIILDSGVKTSKIGFPSGSKEAFFVGITKDTNSFEDGTVSLSNNGYLKGVGTNFTKLLRSGQYKRKSSIKIDTTIYTVERVIDDTSLYLAGVNFPTIIDAKYSILPTSSPFLSKDLDNLYSFDTCRLVLSKNPFDETTVFQIALKINDTSTETLDFSPKTILGIVNTDLLGPDSVQSENIAPKSILSQHILDNEIRKNHIGPHQIVEHHIADDALIRRQLSSNLQDVKSGFFNFFRITFEPDRAYIGDPNDSLQPPVETTSLFLDGQTKGDMFTIQSYSYSESTKAATVRVGLVGNYEFAANSSVQVNLLSGRNWKQGEIDSGASQSLPSLFYDVFDKKQIVIEIFNFSFDPVTRLPCYGGINVSAFIKRTDSTNLI